MSKYDPEDLRLMALAFQKVDQKNDVRAKALLQEMEFATGLRKDQIRMKIAVLAWVR